MTDPYDPEEHGMATHEPSDLTKEDFEDIAKEKLGFPKTPIDPANIDLEPIRETWQHKGVAPRYNIMALIAAVEALRGRVTELEALKLYVQHTDTMNDMVLLGLARDTAEAHATEALEQAKAKDEVVEACRKFERLVDAGQILTATTLCKDTLAKLDALDQEDAGT